MAPRGLSLAVIAGAGSAAMRSAFVAPAPETQAEGLQGHVARPVTVKAARSKGGVGTVVAGGGALALLMRRPWDAECTAFRCCSC